MKRLLALFCCAIAAVVAMSAFVFSRGKTEGAAGGMVVQERRPDYYRDFDVQILVDGRPLEEYAARGRSYVEATPGEEYEVRVRNPFPFRVAVALSVDGLNTIDARHYTAWNSSKWVIEPYGTINVSGWQMSSERARRFYFTSERDSYGAKLGQTSNLGIISAVFFRERQSYPVPVAPPPRPRPWDEDGRNNSESAPSAAPRKESAGTLSGDGSERSSVARNGRDAQPRDDDYAATGIGRSVHNDVRWVNMDLDSRPAGEVLIRYEYYPALVRLGILPRYEPRPDPLRRRERARGFEDRGFSPEP